MPSSVAEGPLRLIGDEDTGDRLLIYASDGGAEVQLRVADESFWATQAQMAQMFGVTENVVTYHLKNIFGDGELDEAATTRRIRGVRLEGNRQVSREIAHYNLNAPISAGYRVGSKQGSLHAQLANLNRAVLRHGGSKSRDAAQAPARTEYAKFEAPAA